MDLRTTVLDQRYHRDGIFMSDWTQTLYRYHKGRWQLYWKPQRRWDDCYDDRGICRNRITGNCGEVFVLLAARVK